MNIENLVVLLAFLVGLALGLILGIALARYMKKTTLVPLGNILFGFIFVGINIYGVVYGVEIPYIFNFMLAMAFGGMLGIDIVKYFPIIQSI